MPYLFENLSDHPSLVGIIRFPKCTFSTTEIKIPVVVKDSDGWFQYLNAVDVATNITSLPVESGTYTISKDDITDYYPYTYYVLTDGEVEPLIMKPQYLPKEFTIKGIFALSNTPVERYYPSKYKADTSGNNYNITNTNQMVLPTATNEGLNFMNANANSLAVARQNSITNFVLSSAMGAVSAVATGGLSLLSTGGNVLSGLMQFKEANARNKDTQLTGTTLQSFGTPSTRQAFNTNTVKILKYSINEKAKLNVKNFYSLYGYKYNRYETNFNLKTYKGFIKMNSIKLSSGLDSSYINKINSILERGVFCE